MLDDETIANQQQLIDANRRTLAHLLQQAAQYGGEPFSPPATANGIREARANIQRAKSFLQDHGFAVDHQPGDEPPTQPSKPDLAPHASVDWVAGDKIAGDKVAGDKIEFHSNYYQSPIHPVDAQEQRNRGAMLAKVKSIWIEGLLEQSLTEVARIDLSLVTKPDAVLLPLNTLVQELNHPARPVLPGTPIIEIFEQMAGALLILGAPGAGKTTLLLELTRDLIARAEADTAHPIPIIFNLASWAEQQQRPLAAWMIDELHTKYDIPMKIGRAWLEKDMVLPLLDGLDEVRQAHQAGCVDAINKYRADHGLVPLVVCSRIGDYDALTTKLRLQNAVIVQPLTMKQIDAYLTLAGDKVRSLRIVLGKDPLLRELAETPLMLNIMLLAYNSKNTESLHSVETLEQRRNQIFETYVRRMFERRNANPPYHQSQVIQWLAWLATQMQQRNQTEFLLERLHPGWLSAIYRQRYNVLMALVRGLAVGAACGLLIGVMVTFLLGFVVHLINARPSTLIYSAIIGMVGFALFMGTVGIFAGLRGETEAVRIVERLRWPTGKGRFSSWVGLMVGTPIALIFGLAFGPFMGLLAGLTLGGTIGILVLSRYLVADEIDLKMKPNQGIWRSAFYAVLTGVGAGLISALGVGLLMRLVIGPLFGIAFGAPVGIAIGLLASLFFGGETCIQHLFIRVMLYYSGHIPRNYIHFLNYATERIFVRKVGGAYIFVHRILMEYFATLNV